MLSRILDWGVHPINAAEQSGTVADWFGFLVLVLILSFLWKTVLNQIV
jgi:hypothetical protein